MEKTSSGSLYAFYGSLRRGHENYLLYKDDLRFIKTIELSGFKMYSLPEYPYIIQTGNSVDKVVAELFAITNAETERTIHEMELGVGYIFSEVEIADIKFGIFLFRSAGAHDDEVKLGDWSVFRKLTGF